MTAPDANALIAGAELAYVADYFSFIGADAQGHVAFAVDTNRGRDGADFRAEHLYAVLHDERRGWVDVRGNGCFPNPEGQLLTMVRSRCYGCSMRRRKRAVSTMAAMVTRASRVMEPGAFGVA